MAHHSLLNRLRTDDYLCEIGFFTTPKQTREKFLRSLAVRELGNALKHGVVTDEDIRDFVDELVSDFRKGELFVHQVPFMALAVCFESHYSKAANDFLERLSTLDAGEMLMAIHVAKLCAKNKRVAPLTSVEQWEWSSPVGQPVVPVHEEIIISDDSTKYDSNMWSGQNRSEKLVPVVEVA